METPKTTTPRKSYMIISNHSADLIADEVEKAMREGWLPLGNVSITFCNTEDYFYLVQAMTKES